LRSAGECSREPPIQSGPWIHRIAGRLPDAPSPAALEKVRATLHAAATDDEVRDAIARGRLEREAESAGAWGGLPLTLGAIPPSEMPGPPASRRAWYCVSTRPAAACERSAPVTPAPIPARAPETPT